MRLPSFAGFWIDCGRFGKKEIPKKCDFGPKSSEMEMILKKFNTQNSDILNFDSSEFVLMFFQKFFRGILRHSN